jgi:hypothetical protein
MDPGDDNERAPGNTVACRANQLRIAKQTGEPGTLPDYCAKAAPGGNGECGSNCESYCQLYAAACQSTEPQIGPTQYDQETCVEKCQGLADTGAYDVDANYTGDTLECRLVHISAASVEPETHCSHAQLNAQGQVTPKGPCLDEATTDPDCDSFCKLEMAECSGEFSVFESLAQCKAVCNALPRGNVTDIKENTVGCRKYHSYNAMFDPRTHCPHTGPGGDGHCGATSKASDPEPTGNCESYCILAEKACAATVVGVPLTSTFEGTLVDTDNCLTVCDGLDGASVNAGYSVSPEPTGDTLFCRLLHVSRALTDPAECVGALGGDPCQ